MSWRIVLCSGVTGEWKPEGIQVYWFVVWFLRAVSLRAVFLRAVLLRAVALLPKRLARVRWSLAGE
jgi:hypothetical protein